MTLSERREPLDYAVPRGRGLYVYAVDGDSAVDGEELRQGDVARVAFPAGDGAERVTLDGTGRILVIDVPLVDGAARAALLAERTTGAQN